MENPGRKHKRFVTNYLNIIKKQTKLTFNKLTQCDLGEGKSFWIHKFDKRNIEFNEPILIGFTVLELLKLDFALKKKHVK